MWDLRKLQIQPALVSGICKRQHPCLQLDCVSPSNSKREFIVHCVGVTHR